MVDSIFWLFFAFAAGIGLFFSMMLLMRPGKLKSGSKPLIFILSLFSLTLIEYVIYWSHHRQQFPHMESLWRIWTYCYGPLLLLFVQKGKIKGVTALHFLPAALLLLSWIPFALLPTAEKFAHLQQHSVFSSQLGRSLRLGWLQTPWLLLGHQLLYMMTAAWLLWRKKEQSRLERQVLGLFAFFWLAQLSYFILVRFSFFNSEWDYMISLAMTIAIFSMASMSFHRPEFFFIQQLISPKKKYASSPLNENQSQLLAKQIQDFVEEKNIFLQENLRLPQLAAELNLSPQQLSQAVNQAFGLSFSEWINRYRVAHACELLSQGLSAKEAGYQSGFRSISTFYDVFKREMGLTPAAFGSTNNEQGSKNKKVKRGESLPE